VFVKGPLHLSTAAQHQQLSQLRLRVTPVPPVDQAAAVSIRIKTNLGTITDDSGRIQQIENQLSPHPASLAEIHEALGIPPEDLVIYTSLLLHAGRVGIDRGEPGDAAIDLCRGVNRRMMELMQGGHNLGFLAAPRIGHGAQPFSLVEVFALEALQQGLEESMLRTCVLMGLQATGAELRGADGLPFTDQDQALEQIQRDINRFREQTLPRLVQLGIA